jgi:MFS family permease
MAAATAAMGCLPTYADIGPPATILLCLLRLVQGLSVGGELVGSMVFAVESMPENRQVLGGALCMAGCIAGLTLGSLSGLILHAALTPEEILHFGWRIPFGCGMLIGLFAMWMRSYTHEPTIYDMMQNDGDQQHMPEETDTTSKTSTSFPAPSLDVNIARAPTNIAIKHSPPQSPSGPAADAEISVVSAEGAPMESDSGTKQFIQAIDKMAQKLDADTHTTLVVSGGNFGGDTLRRYIAQVKPEEGLPVVRALREHRTEIGLCITVSCVWCAGCWLTVAFPPTMYQILMDPPLSDRILGVVASEAGRRAGADSPVYRPGEDTVWIMHSSCCAFQAAAIVALGILGDKIGGIRLFKLGAVGIALLAIPCFHVMSQGTSLAAVGVAQGA